MSFKQAKDIVERLEFSEIALRKSFTDIKSSTKKINESSVLLEKSLEESLEKQKHVLTLLPTMNRKMGILKAVILVNLGFIAGLFVGKFLL